MGGVRADARIIGVWEWSFLCHPEARNYIWVFITNKGAHCEFSKTSTDMTTAGT